MLEEWLNFISDKHIINMELYENYDIKQNIIIIFDIEFLRYQIDKRQIPTIFECGGIILLKKSEKIKNILIYPEPDDNEYWEFGEIPWEPKNETVVEIYEVKNKTCSELRDETNTLSSYNLGMLFI